MQYKTLNAPFESVVHLRGFVVVRGVVKGVPDSAALELHLEVQYKTLNPVWNESFEFVVDLAHTQDLLLEAWDKDVAYADKGHPLCLGGMGSVHAARMFRIEPRVFSEVLP